MTYMLLMATELHLTIYLQQKLVGYEHESEGANFIERILRSSREQLATQR